MSDSNTLEKRSNVPPAGEANKIQLADEENTLNARKKEQRKLCLDARARLSAKERDEKSRGISENLLKCLKDIPEVVPGAVILAYAPFADEADPGICLEKLRAMGIRVAFPAIMPGRQMLAAVPFDKADMKPDRFGIPTPDLRRSETVLPEEIAVIIVPCVGFDRRGRRLGHGWGYYDRFLVRCPGAPRLLIAFAAQELPEIAVGSYDLPMNCVITENLIQPITGESEES